MPAHKRMVYASDRPAGRALGSNRAKPASDHLTLTLENFSLKTIMKSTHLYHFIINCRIIGGVICNCTSILTKTINIYDHLSFVTDTAVLEWQGPWWAQEVSFHAFPFDITMQPLSGSQITGSTFETQCHSPKYLQNLDLHLEYLRGSIPYNLSNHSRWR